MFLHREDYACSCYIRELWELLFVFGRASESSNWCLSGSILRDYFGRRRALPVVSILLLSYIFQGIIPIAPCCESEISSPARGSIEVDSAGYVGGGSFV